MTKKVIIVVLVLLALGGAAYIFVSRDSSKSDISGVSESDSDQMNDMDMSSGSNNQSAQSSNTENTEAVAQNTVEIKDYAYSPAVITVKKGTTVTWTNRDAERHDIAPDTESDEFKESELLSNGESYSVTFNTVGTYTYHCSPHPYMTGKVIVTE